MNLYIGTLQAQESPEPTIDLSKCELEEVWLMIEFDYGTCNRNECVLHEKKINNFVLIDSF